MKIIAASSLGFALLVAGTSSYSNENSEDGTALRKLPSVQLFLTTCVSGRGKPAAVAEEAKKLGFTEASADMEKRYLQQHEGMAWHKEGSSGSYGITVLENGLCSVFIHQGDPTQIAAGLESWLPPAGSGYSSLKDRAAQPGGLTTTSYKVFKGPTMIEQWTLTVSSEPDSALKAILSFNTP